MNKIFNNRNLIKQNFKWICALGVILLPLFTGYNQTMQYMNVQEMSADNLDTIQEYSVVIVPHEKFAGRGNVEVRSKETGEVVYIIEDQFQDPEEYSKIESIDLDKNGKEETLCYGYTGGNGGFINIFVFDFEKSIKPIFSIWSVADIVNLNSADIFVDNGSYTNIIVQKTVGIGAAKRLFYYPLRYNEGILSMDYEGEEFKKIAVNNSDRLLDAIKSMSVDCKLERSKYPFEALYIQNLFIKNEEYALNIIDEFYPCNDKNVILSEVKKINRELSSSKLYKFSE